jgi:hypothetical protein
VSDAATLAGTRPGARARVLAVVAVGRRIADPRDPLGREARERLPEVSGLSPEGVELALREHLERSIAPQEMDTLVTRAGEAPRCHVVLSANVCTAALRAIAFAAATAPAVLVKPSRRDPVVAELVVRALADHRAFAAAGGRARIAAATLPAPGDEVHAYGRDETIAAIRASVPEGVRVLGHGAGLGVAIVEDGAPMEGFRQDIAAAVVPFDQRGCLSPRVLYVEGGADRAIVVAKAAAESLAGAEARVPRGPLDAATRAEIARYVATARALGEAFEGPGYAVGVDVEPRRPLLPPAARVLHVVPVDRARLELSSLVDPRITIVGTSGEGAARGLTMALRRLLPRSVRFAPLGQMQRPPLDGPVDLRPIAGCDP